MFGLEPRADGRVRVKICGITNLADARSAIDCGADALGFNFWKGSRRYLDANRESHWLGQLPEKIRRVAILVDPTWEEAIHAAGLPFIDAIQLHGAEPPEFCRRLAQKGVPFAKALPVRADDGPVAADDYHTDTILLDSVSRRGFGGTGETFPWEKGRDFARQNPALKVILAGGLTPENVARAITAVQPCGVDVSSGVETADGRKDPARMRAFFEAVSGV